MGIDGAAVATWECLMTVLSFQAARFPIRDDIRAVLPRVWSSIGRPGTWLTGTQRVAIAAETRNALGCRLCAERKAALSPNSVQGAHDDLGLLPETWVEVIHRVVSDPGRIAESWYRNVTSAGISERDYVELIGVVVTVVAVDTFHRGIDLAPPDLPTAEAGEPSGEVVDQLDRELAWVPTLDPRFDGPLQREFYTGSAAHIRRALTSVPQTARDFWDMAYVLYLGGAEMRDFANEYRAITHAQIELVAGRVSSLNQCTY